MNTRTDFKRTTFLLNLFIFSGLFLTGCGSRPAKVSDKPTDPDAAAPTQVKMTGTGGSGLLVEAIDDSIARLWLEPSGEFARPASLATEKMPSSRVPVKAHKTNQATQVRTKVMTVEVDSQTLAFRAQPAENDSAFIPPTTIETLADGRWILTRSLAEGERLFGLGQDNHNNGRMDRRGVIRELWAGQQINSGNVTAEYPVPLLIGLTADSRAYGMFFDNVHKLRFDLGATKPDQLRLEADGGEIDIYILNGPKIADVIEQYTLLTGRPSLPPLWSLGYWQSKCTYYDWRALDDAFGQLRGRGFPVDVMVIDYDWPEFYNNFQWAKRWQTDGKTPAEKIAEYKQQGARIVMSQSGPMIRQESPTFATGWQAGVFATDGQGNPVECGHYGGKLLDFTHPAMNDWLWPQVQARLKEGVSGWWLDLTEPEGEPQQTHYYAGRPAEIHNQYSLMCTRSFEDAQLAETPNRRPFVLTRCGSSGMQRHHAAVWTGDVYSDYATLRAHLPEMLNSGLSGLTWWTSDSGGFMNGYYKNDQMGAHARLYERWMQFSVFSPITRAHKAGGLPEPYQFGPAVEQSCLHYLKLRYRLLPYIYSYAWEASRTGSPIARSLALDFQDDPKAAAASQSQYLFGRELLVAPALYEGQTNRRVYFPAGKWIDWDYGYEYEGGRDYVVAAPPNRIPVAVRAGAIIPMAPDMQYTGQKPWDPMTLEIFPHGTSQFVLYQDDGVSFDYVQGKHTVTTLECKASAKSITLTIDESNKLFTPAVYQARFHLGATPTAVKTDDGKTLAFDWSPQTRVLTVPIEAKDGLRHAITIALDAKPLAAPQMPELQLDAIDPSGEASGFVGKPVPHFFPPPALPNRVKAINYDKGGEGVAYHSTRPAPEKKLYRPDDFSIAANDGGEFVLGGLQASEWVRYTINCGNGGWFNLSVSAASAAGGGRIRIYALDQQIAMVDIGGTGSDTVFKEFSAGTIYLNPGEISLMLYVDQPGFRLNTLTFGACENPPAVYPAYLGLRTGIAEVDRNGGKEGTAAIRNLGRVGTSVTLGVMAPEPGQAVLRLHYVNHAGKALPFSLQVGRQAAQDITVPPTASDWQTFDVKVTLQAGGNPVLLSGHVDGWDAIVLDSIEVVKP